VSVGNSVDKLRQSRSVAYSTQQVLLNKQQISGGGAYLHCYVSVSLGVTGHFAYKPTRGLSARGLVNLPKCLI